MDIQTKEALIAEIERFKEEALKMHIVQVLAHTYTITSLFDYSIDSYGSVIWYKAQACQLWDFWQAAKAQAVPEWISVENTIPNKNGDYIVCIDGEPCSAFFKWVNDHWKEFKVGAGITEGIHGWWHTHLNVTHWMPFPKPPKVQEPAND